MHAHLIAYIIMYRLADSTKKQKLIEDLNDKVQLGCIMTTKCLHNANFTSVIQCITSWLIIIVETKNSNTRTTNAYNKR